MEVCITAQCSLYRADMLIFTSYYNSEYKWEIHTCNTVDFDIVYWNGDSSVLEQVIGTCNILQYVLQYTDTGEHLFNNTCYVWCMFHTNQ